MAVYNECCFNFNQNAAVGFPELTDMNDEAYLFASDFSIYDRNIIRKLSKQYQIISIEQPEHLYFERGSERRIVQKRPWIIKYKDWRSNDMYFKPFEWEFYSNNF